MYTFGVIEPLANGVSLINELGIETVDAHIHEMEELLRSLIADLSLKVVEPPRKLAPAYCSSTPRSTPPPSM